MKKINRKAIICDLCTYLKDGELIKDGIYYTISTIIAPLEPELWSYYKGLYGEQSLKNCLQFTDNKEETQKKAARVKPEPLPLDAPAFFAEMAQLWIITKILQYGYYYRCISYIALFLDSILRTVLEHRHGETLPYEALTVELVFNELETLEGDCAAFYREHTRVLFFFHFYREDINRFFTVVNNLIINKVYRDSYIRNAGSEKEIDITKLLPTELDVNAVHDILELFDTYGYNERKSDHKASDDPSSYYIYNVHSLAWLFNDYFGFVQKEEDERKNDNDNSHLYIIHFEKARKALEDSITVFPGLAFLLERASRYIPFKDLQSYFPCIDRKELLYDTNLYLSLKNKQIKAQGGYSWFDGVYLAALERFSFNNDVQSQKPLSDKRLKLLQTLFSAALWSILSVRSCRITYSESELKAFKKLINTFYRSFSRPNCLHRYSALLLNRLIKICGIQKAWYFTSLDFTTLNKSSHFTSNEALLHLYYTVTHFLTDKKYCLLEQLDFTDEMRRRILPLPLKGQAKNGTYQKAGNDSQKNKKEEVFKKNHEYLKNVDCGMSFPYLWQQIMFDGTELCRPHFTLKLWFYSEYEYDDLRDLNRKGNDERKEKIKYRLNKSCLRNHFFYSADRNMETHFSLHHSVEAVLEKPKRLLYALYDIKQYLEDIQPDQPDNCIGFPFLQEKLSFIFSNLCLVLFPECPDKSWESVFDKDGIILPDSDVTFDLFEDFGEEFYATVKEFLEIMFTGQSDWMEKLDFELLIYLIYVTLHVAQIDAERTDDTPLVFQCTEEDQVRWRKTADFFEKHHKNTYSNPKLRLLKPHPYSIFDYQLSDNIHSKNMKQWRALRLSAKIHLYNGNFEKLPPYIRNMHGIIADAQQLRELKVLNAKPRILRESYKAVVTERWNRFATRKCRKTWIDLRRLSLNDSFNDFRFHAEKYDRLSEIDGFKQKVFYVWCYHVKCVIALALSDDGLRIELFFGVKSRSNLIPVYSVTADCKSLIADRDPNEPLAIIFNEIPQYLMPKQKLFWSHSYRYLNDEDEKHRKRLRERKCTLNNTLKNLYRNILQECSAEFFKTDLPCDDSPECTTLAELCEKLDGCFSTLAQKQENKYKPRWVVQNAKREIMIKNTIRKIRFLFTDILVMTAL